MNTLDTIRAVVDRERWLTPGQSKWLLDEVLGLYDAVGAALALLRQESYGAATIVLETALKGKTMHSYDPPPPDIPDEHPDPTPGGPEPGEW